MNTSNKLAFSISLAGLALPAALAAQDDGAELNFVRDWMGYRVVSEFAPNPNNIEVFNDYCIDFQADPAAHGGDCAPVSPYGIEYGEFLALLEAAYAEGRGGVINFETPILGPAFRAPNRLGHRAFIEQFILDNPLENYDAQVREEYPELGDADVLALSTRLQQLDAYAAAEAELLDPADIIPVVARNDRGLDDTEDNPLQEILFTHSVIGFYGPDKDIPLVISRGERAYTEGQLATRNVPAPWALGAMMNGEFFNNVGVSTYAGSSGNYRPVSGINTLNNGMQDMRFDPRDNVTALGFVFLSFNNFQYYQGDSGVPVNPNNMRVLVEFSNGETEELAQTSRQSGGNWDVFFAVRAPEGASITRVWCRVIGRNWRTFVSLDDVAFITEPALSYVVGDTAFTGTAGAEFYEIVRIGQNPQSVSIRGLPAGISYDSETGLISGVFAEAGSFTATVSMTNVVGTAEQTLAFEVTPAGDPESYLNLDPVDDVIVVLRRNLAPLTLASNLDGVLPPGSIAYFSIVERIRDDGSRAPSSLDFLGLTLRDNTLFGTPGSAQQIGNYEVTVYARTESSASSVTFPLSVLAPTVSPNFDSNKTTDFALLSGGGLWTALSVEQPGQFGQAPLQQRLSGIPEGAMVFTGDFNGDNQTDMLVWDAAAGSVRQYLSEGPGGGFSGSALLEGVVAGSGEDIVAVADYDGDGTSDIFWRNDARQRISIWLMRSGKIAWAGLLEQPGGAGELLLTADFAGDGSLMHLYRSGPGAYRLDQYNVFTTLGAIQHTSVAFTMDPQWEPLFSADFTNDGRQDIAWEHAGTGEMMFWAMDGTSTATPYFNVTEPEEEDGEVLIEGRKGPSLVPPGFDWSVVTAIDLNNDQYADLVLRNRFTEELGVLFMRENRAAGVIKVIGAATQDVLTAGDFDGDSRNDLLLVDRRDDSLAIVSLDGEGLASPVPYGTNPAGAAWFCDYDLRNATSPVDPAYIWPNSYVFLTNQWFHMDGFGFLAVIDPQARIYYDPVIDFIWTTPEVYPHMFHYRRNDWVKYIEGSENPRRFLLIRRGREFTEDRL
jgi:hypothetical protein